VSPDADDLARYVSAIAYELGLRDWRFQVEVVSRPKGYHARVHPIEGRRFAVIRFPPDFTELTPQTQRNAVVHELIHCHLAAATDIWRLDVGRHLGQSVYDAMWSGYKREVELATDTLATAIDHLFPLPPWTEA
jgi:hypothetical protein